MVPQRLRRQRFTTPQCVIFILLFSLLRPPTGLADSVLEPDAKEVRCGLHNVALCKPASQHGTHHQAHASKGVDGDRRSRFHKNSCFHTPFQEDNWWMVDLMEEFLIHKIIVTNRIGTLDYRLNDVTVDLYTSDPTLNAAFPNNTDGINCVEWTPYFEETKTFDCSTPTFARYVKLYKRSPEQLHACEVEVYASQKRGDPSCLKSSKTLHVMRNSKINIAVVMSETVTDTGVSCVMACTGSGDMCNGCTWRRDTGDCTLLLVNPHDPDMRVKGLPGTDLYLEMTKDCLNNGWVYTST